MTTTVRQRVTVDADGAVRVQSEQFRPGEEAEVVVLVERTATATPPDADGRDDGPIPPGESAFDAFLKAGLIGVFSGPGDLSTNPKHMEGFGQSCRERPEAVGE